MKRNKEQRPMTRKEYIIWMAVALGLFAIFLGLLITAAVLQDNGVSEEIYNPIGFSSFAFIALSLVVLFSRFKSAMGYEIAEKMRKVDETECTVLEGANERRIREALTAARFTKKDEYYYKRRFSLAKDYINYFVRFADAVDVESSIDSETAKIDTRNYANKNKCLILMLSLENVTKEDIEKMKEFNKAFIVAESIDPYIDSAVCVLIDKSEEKAYLIRSSKLSISIYSHGEKLIEKMIKG